MGPSGDPLGHQVRANKSVVQQQLHPSKKLMVNHHSRSQGQLASMWSCRRQRGNATTHQRSDHYRFFLIHCLESVSYQHKGLRWRAQGGGVLPVDYASSSDHSEHVHAKMTKIPASIARRSEILHTLCTSIITDKLLTFPVFIFC